MNKSWLTKLVILVFLFSTFSNSLLITKEAFAEGDDNDFVYEDGEYHIPVTFLHENKEEQSSMQNYVKDDSAKIEVVDGKAKAFLTFTSADMIPSFKIEENSEFIETTVEKEHDDNSKEVSFKVNDLSDILVGEVTVDTKSPMGEMQHKVRIQFDPTEIAQVKEEETDSSTPEEDIEATPDNSEEETTPDEEKENPVENESSNEEENDKEDNDTPSNEQTETDKETEKEIEEKPKEESTPEDNEALEDGIYTLSYTSEGVNLGSYYAEEAIVIVENGTQYLQLQGKSMRNFVEYLYLDGKRMDIGEALNEKGEYIAQKKLDEKITDQQVVTFTMVINAAGRIMAHQGEVSLDLDTLEKVNDSEYNVIEGVPATENDTFITAEEATTYGYDSGEIDLSRYYEDTIDVIEKDGKQYLNFKGTGMSTFIEALYVDGKKMAMEENDDGSYIAQIEHSTSVQEPFKFDMVINAMGRIMHHGTEVTLQPQQKNGEYLIDFDVLQEKKDETSTASPYIVKPTKLVIKDDVKQLFIKVTDHETIEDFKIKQGDTYVSPEVISTNEKANTRIVAFEIDSMADIIHAQVKVNIPGNYESEQPFRIKLDPNSLKEYDGSLEVDEEKQEALEDGHYTINFRTLDHENFEKVAVGKHLNPPAQIELKDGKYIVTLTIDEVVEKFEIEEDGKFTAGKIVNENSENGTYDVQFEIDDPNAIIVAKMDLTEEKQRSNSTSHKVRLFFEGNSMEPMEEKEEDPEEQVELVAEAATEVNYQILKDENDDISSANNFFSGKAVILEHEGNKYAQITTQKEGAQYIKSLKNMVNGSLTDMVIVEEDKGERTYQFKLDGDLTAEVMLNMFISVSGMYEMEHDARLIFDTKTEKEANPEDYVLIASTNANGPDGDDAQTPGGDPKPDPDPTPNPKPEPTPTPDPNPTDVDTYTMDYKILNENKKDLSIANNYFTGKATLIEDANNTYVQIATKDNSGKFIESLQNKLGKDYKEMLIVQNKNGDKIYQFKLGQLPGELVPLKMKINVPGIYDMEHEAFLQFDTTTLMESEENGTLYQDKAGIQGPKDKGSKVPTTNPEKKPEKQKQPKKNDTGKEQVKGDINPDKAFAIDYVIKQEASEDVSVADEFFTGKAILLEKGKKTYAQITTKDAAGQYIDALRSQFNGKFVDMTIVERNGDDLTFQFKLDGSESDPVLLDMIITVPGVYENQAHKARLFFDPSTKKEVDASQFTIAGESKKEDMGKPTFGNGSESGSTVEKGAKETNPKTSDMTMIVFYSVLLVIAGVGLFLQLRRKLVKQ